MKNTQKEEEKILKVFWRKKKTLKSLQKANIKKTGLLYTCKNSHFRATRSKAYLLTYMEEKKERNSAKVEKWS